MKIKLIILSFLILLNGCYAGIGAPVPGLLYSKTTTSKLGIGDASDSKEGVSECESIMGLISTGDCSIEAAKKEGHISKIQYVDYRIKNILGVYATYQTVVRGE